MRLGTLIKFVPLLSGLTVGLAIDEDWDYNNSKKCIQISGKYPCGEDETMDENRTEKLMEIVGLVDSSSISTIKEVIGEILGTIRDVSTSAKDLKDLIEKDPPLCAKLLKRANSAYYGYPRTISDIQEAIVCLGFDAVKELALNQKACDLFEEEEVFEGFSRWSLWKHSVAVAECSKMLYRKVFKEHGEDSYAVGLLHDLGIIVENQFFDYQFKQALKKSSEEKTNLHCAEKEILLVNHAEIGQAIMVNWNFPDEMSSAIGFHHEPNLLKNKEVEKNVLILFLANRICQRKDIGYSDAPYEDNALFQDCLDKLNIKKETLDLIVEELTEHIKKMEEMKWL